MTKISYKLIEDKELFKEELRHNLVILLGNKNRKDINNFYKEFKEKLISVKIVGWKDKTINLNQSTPGISTFSLDGTSLIELYGHKDVLVKEFLKRSFSHEIWHSIITFLCSQNLSVYNKSDLEVNNYSGLLSCKDREGTYSSGYMFNECFVDMLAIISNNLFYDSKYSIDDILNFDFEDKYGVAAYNHFFTFFQVFIAAFNLDVRRSYQENFDKGNGLLGYSIVTETNKEVKANLFLDGLFENPLSIVDEFNKYVDKDLDYVYIANTIDKIYFDYKKYGYLDIPVVLEVLNVLSTFTRNRLKDYYLRKIISKSEAQFLWKNYQEVLLAFKSEIKTFKVLNSKASIKFKFGNMIDSINKKGK